MYRSLFILNHLYAFIVKCGDKTFVCCVTFLNKSIFNADIDGIIHKLIVFFRCDFVSEFRKIFLNSLHRSVLVHYAYVDIVAVCVIQIGYD